MSVIDKALREQMSESASITLREAAATILVASVASDGTVAPEEAARINMLVPSMRLYRQTAPEHLQHLIEAATARVAGNDSAQLLMSCAAVIPEELRAPLFAMAVDLVFVDGRVTEREKQFADALQMALSVPDDTALKIVEVLLLKSRA